MPGELIGPAFNGVGVVALLGALFWLLATGRLVTRREADRIEADCKVWRDTALEQKGLVTTLLSGQETTNRLLRSIPHVKDESE